jgi:hypothetical protein
MSGTNGTRLRAYVVEFEGWTLDPTDVPLDELVTHPLFHPLHSALRPLGASAQEKKCLAFFFAGSNGMKKPHRLLANLGNARRMFALSPSRLRTWCLPFALACLITCGSTALQGQSEEEKQERAEILRLMDSSKAEDRNLAVKRLRAVGMDFSLLWKLMNDPAPSVRLHAIDGFSNFGDTVVVDMTPELAQKMILLLEPEVTQERIDAALHPGQIQDAAAFPRGLLHAGSGHPLCRVSPVPESP